MTYLGQEKDFVKPQYSLTLFEAYFRHSLGTLSACNAFLSYFCSILASKKFYKFICYLGKTSLNCPKCSKYDAFYLDYMHAQVFMLIFDQELAISSSRMFLFFILPSFQASYEMTIKPINRTIGGTIICRFTP